MENQPYVAKSLYINVILFQKICVYESSHSIDNASYLHKSASYLSGKTQYTQVTGCTNRTMRADPKGLHLLHLTSSLERNEQMQEHFHVRM
jgi:hypothetical protein